MKFKLTKDYNGNGINLKAGEYSKEELVKLYQDEGRFNFCLTCTSLKDVLEEAKEEKQSFIGKVLETIASPSVEELNEELEEVSVVETVYIAKEDIKKGKKVIFKKDDKITDEELEKTFGDKLDNSIYDLLLETKIVKNDTV
jgi:predicted adenine nucleotide alpha hydrolase (AANH) superfamily ATPase